MSYGPRTRLLMEKAGRNLFLFQEIEHLLKGLVSLGAIHSSLKSGNRVGAHLKQSLGQVATTFIGRHLLTESPDPKKAPELFAGEGDMIFQSSFHLKVEAEDDLAERIRRAIPDRNRLAHSLLLDFDVTGAPGIEEAGRWLDESHEEHSGLLETLRSHHREVRESFLEILTLATSKEGTTLMFLPDIQRLPVVERLRREAALLADEDGWVPVAKAVKGESVAKALERFGMKSLTELMIASRLFEVRAEETARGGTRMVYRVVRSAD